MLSVNRTIFHTGPQGITHKF